MSQVPHLRRLFRYDDWANREAARALAAAGHPSERARKLLAHIAGAEWVWRSRIRGEPQSVAVWPEWDIGESTRQIASLRDAWERDLGELDDSKLERAVVYVNTAGTKFSSALGDILMHVVMHSGYHRGQIAAEMRAAGDEPAYTDFIHAARQGKIE